MNFTLNDTQQKVLEKVAEAEMRSVEQMLSMLLVQGVRFYFCDYCSPFYNIIWQRSNRITSKYYGKR